MTNTMNDPNANTLGHSGMAGDPSGKPGPWVWPLQRQIFLMLQLSVIMFAVALQAWNIKSFQKAEILRAKEKHLVIASNLSLALSRYINDAARVFAFSANNMLAGSDANGDVRDLLSSLNVEAVAILPPPRSPLQAPFWFGREHTLPSDEVLRVLRHDDNTYLDGVQISGLQQIDGRKFFILGYDLPDGRLVIGYLNTSYIRKVQKTIDFGKLGHSAIFDQFGRVVAHPSRQLEKDMTDASNLRPIRRMLNRETGVEQFFSPPMQLDMIAGLSFVPETGWAVMVPQPMRELSRSVNSSLAQTFALSITLATIIGFIGWFAAQRIVRPVSKFIQIGEQIAIGNYDPNLPIEERSSAEMWQLNEALKQMVLQIQHSDRQLRQAVHQQEDASKRKSEFLATAGHELRTPLNGVIGMLSICDERNKDDELSTYIHLAKKSAYQLNALVDDVISFNIGESGLHRLQPTTVNLEREIGDLADTLRKQAVGAGLAFFVQAPATPTSEIVIDKVRLVQMLSKLIENAIKFTKVGHVTLSYGLTTRPGNDRKWLTLGVADSGIGIDPAKINLIFEPFRQVESTFARNFSGMGIGLSVAQEIALKMGGFIECDSRLGEGSKFLVWIPVDLA